MITFGQRARVLLGSALCAFLIYHYVWNIHPGSRTDWNSRDVFLWTGLLFGPLVMLSWSFIATSTWRESSLRWARILVLVHAATSMGTVIAYQYPGVLRASFARGYGGLTFLALGAFILDFIVLGIAPRAMSPAGLIRFYRSAMLVIAGGTLLGLLLWSFANIGIVVWRAEAKADGRPYCLQVQGHAHGRYRPVSSLFDLRGLKMQTWFTGGGSDEFQYSFHAVLALEAGNKTEWFNWSYWQQDFVPISVRSFRALHLDRSSCETQAAFLRKLPLTR
jgi:hypothetical protein